MVNKIVTALVFTLGLTAGAIAQDKLYTLTPLDENDFAGSSVACLKAGGQGAMIYDLNEDGTGELIAVTCIKEAKPK